MIIPKRFLDKLSGLGDFQSATGFSLIKIENYLHMSPKFFPEYTNHGLKHVERVLHIADKLIPDKTLDKLSERDISVLVLSVCMHDLGMFIERDGLRDILFGVRKNNKMDNLDKNDWNDEWKEYSEKIRRYSERKLKKIYGRSEAVKIPEESMENLTETDIFTFGNFLRQHHHRLAHEIAVTGFPEKYNTFLLEKFKKEIANLIGVITRSHGMIIRETTEFIATYGADDNSPLGIPVYYLMCIVRLADYLDAGYDRAPHVIDNMQEKSSPVSIEEWSWNQVIDYRNYKWTADLASLNIHASPTKSSQFVKVAAWLKSVQEELDLCWAILGEFYRYKYELSIRRITSNIMKSESKSAFDKLFLTQYAAISANPDIVKLMIEPLYGNEPSFGVRELIQNSVDACNEREFIEKSRGNSTYKGIIDVIVNKKKKIFTIKDNGIGMSSHVIVNYFLQAGSSFRHSDIWIKKFTDSNNKSVIRRSGRFGVGFLATYLLGKNVKITTRNTDDSLGHCFSVLIDDDQLDIERVNAEIGTTIEIQLDEDIVEFFDRSLYYNSHFDMTKAWNKWFYFSKPSVNYYINNLNVTPKLSLVPNEHQNMENWFQVEIPGYKKVQWSIEAKSRTYCNGIVIQNSSCAQKPYTYEYFYGREFFVESPAVSFVDYNGTLPINLKRTEVSYDCSFDLITQDTYRYLLAEMLCTNVDSVWTEKFNLNTDKIDGVLESKLCNLRIVYGAEGYVFNTRSFLLGANVSKILNCEIIYTRNKIIPGGDMTSMCINFCRINNRGKREYREDAIQENETYLNGVKISKKVTYIPKEAYIDLLSRNKFRKRFLKSILIDEIGHHYCIKQKSNKASSFINLELMEKLATVEPLIYEFDIKFERSNSDSGISDILHQYLGENSDYWIPYDFKELQDKFPLAFEKLGKYRPNGQMELIKPQ